MSSTGPLEQAKPTCDVGPFISESGPQQTSGVILPGKFGAFDGVRDS